MIVRQCLSLIFDFLGSHISEIRNRSGASDPVNKTCLLRQRSGSARQAARAVLGEMAGIDLGELGRVIGDAEFWIAEEVAGLEGAAFGRGGEVGRETGDGDQRLAFGLGGGDGFQQGAGVGVERFTEDVGPTPIISKSPQ
jgi:hypothetical protein